MRLRHPGPVVQAFALAMWPVIITLSPVILLVGEPVNRYLMQWPRWATSAAGVAIVRTDDRPVRVVTPLQLTMPSSLLLIAISNPLWIALTAPGRWVADWLSTPPSPGRRVSAS